MKHFLLAAFLIALVKGDRSNLATPHSQYSRTQNARLLASSDRILNTKRSPIAFPQPEFNFPQLGEQFLQRLQQSENDAKGNYGVPAPQIRQNNNYNQDTYKHQDLDEDSEEEDSPEKLNSYGVKSAYESPQQSQSQQVNQNNGQNVVQNVKYLSGFVPSFGPPTKSPQDIPQNSNAHYEHVKEDGSKIFKHVSVHVAPESISSNREPRIIKAQGPREKHYNIIFVKAPEGLVQDTEVHLQPPPQQKTVVYVLAKDQEQKSNIKLATPAPTQVSAPEVYFVRYKDEKNGKTSQYEKEAPTYGPPMQNAYFPLTSPTPTTFAALTFPTINSVYQTEASPYNVPVLSPATSYSTPPNSYVTVNPTFAPTVFSTLSPTSQTTTAFGTPLTLFQSLTLEEIGTPPNSLRQQTTSSQFTQNLLQNIQENRQNYNQQYSQENQENQQKQQYQNQFQQENHQQQQQVQQQQLENSQQQNNNYNFQPSRLIQEFRNSAPVQQKEQQQQQYNKPAVQEEQQREYQLVQPPSQQGDYQIVQANPPQHFHISLPNHHFQTPVSEQSGEYSSTTITATKAQQSEEDEHFPLVFEATRTTSRLNQENNSEPEKNRLHSRKRKVKRGRKRLRKVKKSRRNKNKEQTRNHNQH